MSAIIPKANLSSLTPARLPVDLDRALSIAHNALEGGEIPERSLPAPDQMQALAGRVQDIRGYLAPARPDEIAVHVAKLFMGLAKRSEGFDDEAQRIALYVEVLSGVPRFAVEKACGDFLYGRVGDGKWVPSPGEIRQEALRHCAPWVAELDRINAVLNASVIAPNEYGERAANLKHVQETLRILKGAVPKNEVGTRWAEKMQDVAPGDLNPKVAAEKWLEAYEETPKGAPVIGDGLRKYLDRNFTPAPSRPSPDYREAAE